MLLLGFAVFAKTVEPIVVEVKVDFFVIELALQQRQSFFISRCPWASFLLSQIEVTKCTTATFETLG